MAETGAPSRREGIPLGRIAGVPVVLAYSWFVIAAFTVIVYGPVLGQENPALGASAYIVAFAYAVLLLISVLVHELAHALTARIYGWPTQKIVLNLWGGHTQFESFTATPGRSVLVALAGPAANFVLAAGAWLVLGTAPLGSVAEILTNIFMWANFLIAVFNVLPGLPLDGGRLVESAVWKVTGSQAKGTVAAGWGGRIIVVAICYWFIARPLLAGASPDFSLLMITVLVGSFLWMGASASIQQGTLRGRLHLVSAAGLSTPATGLPATATVEEALRHDGAGASCLVVCGPDGRPEGVVDAAALSSVPAHAAASTPITAVSFALAPGAYVPEWSKGQELLQFLSQLEGRHYAVVDHNGKVTGLLSQDAVLAAITGKPRRPDTRRQGQNR
ncbi:site-2 protease family protein [Arthrobacter sp. BB-1]|uniref:site-2 protease family protein n=1 Tax=unclassified Arthrobacter TaxID=235627 RepID=UPI0010DD859D|nr:MULTISPECIES: site-2 protease family protein [unclassified Arthrobacter]TNB72396.1 site-2 protease family protein [Arthrobacter sp. BB-1]VII96009.1 Peptidase M50 [Arthrobacter sp. DR-2P]